MGGKKLADGKEESGQAGCSIYNEGSVTEQLLVKATGVRSARPSLKKVSPCAKKKHMPLAEAAIDLDSEGTKIIRLN